MASKRYDAHMTRPQSNPPARIVIHGAAGRMGQALIRAIEDMPGDAQWVGAIEHAASPWIGKPLTDLFGSTLFGADAPPFFFSGDLDASRPADVLIDFTGAIGFDRALDIALAHGLALVSGSTGISDMQRARLQQAAQTIPVLWSANFSLGVAMLKRAVREVAAKLPDWDCDILEMHHKRKQDAPSGTALALGEAIAQGRKIALDEHAVYTRHGQIGPRKPAEIGFATLRGGDVVGEHTVIFAADGERLELSHRATDRTIFARGALVAAIWLAGRSPGLYTFDQVLEPAG
jgi:4-hydroxy-tetrahydrodipicolinate reductase